jgi:cation diffusion facilitator CzcD-associated flavoprotein CzcO
VPERFDAVVVGGGQAGLGTSCELTRRGIDHVVLERGEIGQTWRDLWESFCLVTPNWSVQLPMYPYDGDDPDGFLPRDEIVRYLERYADATRAPIRQGVDVATVKPAGEDGFVLTTSDGDLRARSVVVATGTYARAHRPHAGTLPPALHQMDVRDYRRPSAIPDGAVLIVGSGQSGCQIAEELHLSGREVILACGRAPWFPRRLEGHDLVWWAAGNGFLDVPVGALPTPKERLTANPLATGHDGGRDLHLRTLAALGVRLEGHFVGWEAGRFRFAEDLAESVAWGDRRYASFADLILKMVDERGMEPVEIPDPEPFDDRSTSSIDAAGLGTVLFAGGFRPNFSCLGEIAGGFDDLGFPIHEDGQSTALPGLFFVGVHFLRKRKSAIFYGVGEDAAIVARAVAARS